MLNHADGQTYMIIPVCVDFVHVIQKRINVCIKRNKLIHEKKTVIKYAV
jgi:hypothetical protein